MTQFLRYCKLVVADGGDGLDLSGLRVKFQITKDDAKSPNKATITVYNLADETSNRIRKEFERVVLYAGYEDSYGIIFDGNIKSARAGVEGVDIFLEITAGDGDTAYNYSVVNTTLAKGSTSADHISTATKSLNKFNVKTGYIDPAATKPLPRGKVMYGMSRDVLDRSCGDSKRWSIQDGQVQVVPTKGNLPNTAVLLRPDTGLIGRPEQGTDGINARCLINPQLRVGGLIKIEAIDIQEANQNDDQQEKAPTIIATDGVYAIIKLEYSGDTRGTEWYCDLTCETR